MKFFSMWKGKDMSYLKDIEKGWELSEKRLDDRLRTNKHSNKTLFKNKRP